MTLPRIIITPGEPAGVGPDIAIQLAQQPFAAEIVVIGDPTLLAQRANSLGLPLTLSPFAANLAPLAHQPGALKIIPVSLHAECHPGILNVDNANYVIQCLELAMRHCVQYHAAMVTGPVHKGVINDAGIPFSGHTEFLAQHFGCKQAVMLFVTAQTKVALATTHLALSDVPKAITVEKLQSVLRILNQALIEKFGITHPRILVCGLNPHAGENGHLGREEITLIEPALQALRKEKIQLIGPLAADTIFTEKQLRLGDAVLAMYHDQALPIVKYLGFGNAVNLTLGLPIIRTSVDHGTALDVAGTAQADASSLIAATQLAIELASRNNRLTNEEHR